MKTKRAYIDCALEAALAAKNHGIRLVNKKGASISFYKSQNGLSYHWHGDYDGEYYIHTESLPLLEPSHGDVILMYDKEGTERAIYTGGQKAFVVAADVYRKEYVERIMLESLSGLSDHPHWKIIQRNGLSFPKISYEDS